MALLSLTNVTKRYGALVVTDGISLEVAEGEIVGILGPNGAGKTTLFNLVAGTVRPDAGKVTFQGDDVTRARRIRALPARHLALLPDPAPLFRHDGVRKCPGRRHLRPA